MATEVQSFLIGLEIKSELKFMDRLDGGWAQISMKMGSGDEDASVMKILGLHVGIWTLQL